MEFSRRSTEEVGTAARAGDGEALEELCSRLRVSFLVIAKRRVWDIDLAEDLAHDALAIVAEKIGEVPGDIETVPWCLAVLRNIIGNHYSSRRRLERLGPLVGGFATRWHGGVDSDVEQARDEIDAALPKLPSRCRQLVEWILEGYTAEEMQQFLSLPSRNALYMRLYRCREELKAIMEKERGT